VKIDAFCHIMPRPYYDRFFSLEVTPHAANLRKRVSNIPCLADMDVRFTQMDEFGDYRQIINIAAPAMFGAAHALRCSIDFYGTDHILFGSDSPYDLERGPGYIRATIKNLQEIGLSEKEQDVIFRGNVISLTGLTIKD
jgi:hypothetical protein